MPLMLLREHHCDTHCAQVLAATQKFVSLHCLLTGGHITLQKTHHSSNRAKQLLYSCYSYLHCCCSARLARHRASALSTQQLSRHKKLDSVAASTAEQAPPHSTDIETAFGKLRHGDAPVDPKMPPQRDSPSHRHSSSVIIRDTFHEQLAPALERAVAATAVLLQSYQTARLHILYGLDQTADGRRSSRTSSSGSRSSSSGSSGAGASVAATRPGNELVNAVAVEVKLEVQCHTSMPCAIMESAVVVLLRRTGSQLFAWLQVFVAATQVK
jgi:hypothetical protein